MHTSLQTKPLAVKAITLHSIGRHIISAGDREITPSQPRLFAFALYLIMERGKNISRDTLRRLFWPDEKDPLETKQALRQLMHRLRSYGFPIPTHAASIKLPHNFAIADIDGLNNDFSDSVDDIRFLADYNPTISSEFSEWLKMGREIVHKQIATHLLNLGKQERERYNWSKVDTFSSLCLQIQPFNNDAVYMRAEAMAVRNNRSGAITILDDYTRKLPDHFNTLSAHKLLRRIKENVPVFPYSSIRQSSLVGRNEDVAKIQEFIDRARHSKGGSFLLLGDAGIGKSRLVEEAERYALLTESFVEVIKCQQGDENTPLSMFLNLIPNLKKLPGAAGCNADTKEILRRVTLHESRSLASHDVNESESMRVQLKLAFRDLADAIAHEQPLLLIVEDIHWIDKTSAGLLNDLITWSGGRQIGVMLTSRVSYNDCMGAPIPGSLIIRSLGELSPEETQFLAKELAYTHGQDPDHSYINDAAKQSQGNPYFLHELIKQWADTGERYLIPLSLKHILNDRIDRINPEHLRVLQTVVLLGKHATLERAGYILDKKVYELENVINELNAAGMLIIEGQKIRSRHDLLTTEVVSRMPADMRQMLHRRIAHVLERELENQESTSILWDCAEHFKASGELDQARWIMMLCGQHISDLGYQEDAADTFARALQYCTSHKEKLTLLQMMATVQNAAGMHTACRQTITQAQDLASKLYPSQTRHDDYELLGLHSAWKSMTNWNDIMSSIRNCLWDESASDTHKIQAATIGLKIASDLGSKYIIEEMHRSVARSLRKTKVDREIKLEFELIHATMTGSLNRAKQKAKDLISTTKNNHTIQKQINRQFNCAVPFLRSGNFITGKMYLEEALFLAEKYHLYKMVVLMASKLIYNYLALEKPSEARAVFNRIRGVKDQVKDEPVTYQFLMRLEEQIVLVDADITGITPVETEYQPLLDSQCSSGNARLDEMSLYIHRCLLEGTKLENMENILDEMVGLYKDVRIVGGQDYPTYVLVKGLQAIGKAEQARVLLREYVDEYRLEKWPMASKLVSVIKTGSVDLHWKSDQL